MIHRTLLAVILVAAFGAPAPAAAPRNQKLTGPRAKVAELQRRVLAAGALETLTPEGIITALGVRVDPPRMVTADRTEWTVRPSDLYAGGRIARAGDWVVVEVAPAPTLQVSFEDLAGGMLKLPYYRDTAASQVGDDLAPRSVFASNHMFLVPAGLLAVQVPSSVPADADDHDRRASQEGHDTTLGLNSRSVRVGTILLDNEAPARDDSEMIPLEERRARARLGGEIK